MTDADARAQEIARCVRGCTTDEQYIELVDRIASALRERPTSYAAGIEDAAKVADDCALALERGSYSQGVLPSNWADVNKWRQIAAAIRALAPEAGPALPMDRDTLGRMVREAWVRWAQQQPAPKPSWLLPYDELSEPDKEADRQIGETVAKWTLIHESAHLERNKPHDEDSPV